MSNQTYSCFSKGSEWRRWDLHLHTSSSYDAYKGDDADEKLIESLRNNSISAVAITDHFLIDAEKIRTLRKLAPEITFFPGVELRTDKGAANVHVILIFSEKADLKTLEDRFNVVMLGDKAKSSDDNRTIIWDFNDIVEFAKKNDGLISVHAGKKSNGIDKEITNALPHNIAIKQDYANNVDIFEIGQVSDVEVYEKHVFPQIGIKPLVICSDNHVPKDYRVKEFLWIKGNPTFEGLKQVIYEPEERVRIQHNKPDEKRNYEVLESLELNDGALWSGKIEFSENLNTIIGGRSTGKSSLLSAIARKLGNNNASESKNYEFITNVLPNITINWKDGQTDVNRDIEFFPQSYMNLLAFDSDKRNELVENIVKKKDSDDVLGIHSRFIIEQKSVQEKLVSEIFRTKDEVEAKATELSELGDKSGVSSEIERLREELDKFQSKLSEEESVEYESTNSELTDISTKLEQIQKYERELSDLIGFNFFSLSDEEYSQKFSHDIFGDGLSIKFTELKSSFVSQWDEAVQQRIERLKAKEESLIANKKALELTDIFIKGQEHLGKNAAAQELSAKLKLEKQKLLEIEDKATQLDLHREKLDSAIDKLAETHQQLKERAETLSNELRFEQSNLAITVNCPVDRNAIEKILEDHLNRTRHRDYIASYIDSYDENPMETVKGLIRLAIGKELSFKGSHTAQSLLNQTLCTNTYKQNYELTYQNDTFNSMSQGKQAFVILKLLLEFNDKTCPVLIDQPEDSLDNRAIYNELVFYLKQKKKERQIILVTHNPNVVVSADAEQVIVANQHDPKAKNTSEMKFQYVTGGIEHCQSKDTQVEEILYSQGIREHICEILEGGEDAFRKREQKYQLNS